MANELNMKYNTLLAKLAGKQPIKLDEAFRIQSAYAPDKTIEWLFNKSAQKGGVKMEETKVTVTLDTSQFEEAIYKANELVDTIKRAKTLSNDLACMVENLNFKPCVNEKREGDL